MKLLRFLSVILCAAVLCGCTGGTGKPSGGAESAPVTYKSANYIQMIDCENGSLYALTSSSDPESGDYSAHISVYDPDGNITSEATVPEVKYFDIKAMCVSGGEFFSRSTLLKVYVSVNGKEELRSL